MKKIYLRNNDKPIYVNDASIIRTHQGDMWVHIEEMEYVSENDSSRKITGIKRIPIFNIDYIDEKEDGRDIPECNADVGEVCANAGKTCFACSSL